MLGDENNADLFDFADVDVRSCAVLVIDEIGNPEGRAA